jgi:hypothetical protein
MLLGSGIVAQTNTWEGDVSNDWLTAGNWSQGSVPDASDDVIIPSGTTYSPMLDDESICNSITIQTGADLEMVYGGYLQIYNDFESYGSITFSGFNTVLEVYGDIYWKSGSSVITTNIGQTGDFYPLIIPHGSWVFESGSYVVMDSVDVDFQ